MPSRSMPSCSSISNEACSNESLSQHPTFPLEMEGNTAILTADVYKNVAGSIVNA